jgi:hypothetical protein
MIATATIMAVCTIMSYYNASHPHSVDRSCAYLERLCE